MSKKGRDYFEGPRTLTFARHGNSDRNNLRIELKNNNYPVFMRDILNTHTSEARLTPKGVTQGRRLGSWIDQDFRELAQRRLEKPFENVRAIVSTYARAVETAGHATEHAKLPIFWELDPRLVERNYGDLDRLSYEERLHLFTEEERELRAKQSYFFRAGNGETFQDMAGGRLSAHFRDIWERHRGCDVLEIDHGEVMWVKRFMIEGWHPRQLAQMILNTEKEYAKKHGVAHDTQNQMINTRIVQYTCEREDGSWSPTLCRFRLVNPAHPDDPKWNIPWQPLVKKLYTGKDLLEMVEPFKQYFQDVT